MVLVALAVQRLEKSDEGIDVLRCEPKRTDPARQVRIGRAAAVVELHHIAERRQRSVVHIGRMARHVPQCRCLEAAAIALIVADRESAFVLECPCGGIPPDTEVVEAG